MSRPAPGVERAVLILNFLAAHPGEEFSLSELARRLELSKATCHAVLTTLTAAGYLIRHPTRAVYRLGPALIALGSAAEQGFAAVDFAREEMRSLADRLQLECLATAAVGEEIVVLARAGVEAPLGVSVRLGQRLPLVPPLGTVFLAWSPPADIDAWLLRVGAGATDRQLDRYRAAVAAVRRRGFAVALDPQARIRLGAVLAELAEAPQRAGRRAQELVAGLAAEEYALVELEGARTYRVNHIAAPVFGPDGGVVLALTLVGLPPQLEPADVPHYALDLCRSAALVTKAIHGRPPDPTPEAYR